MYKHCPLITAVAGFLLVALGVLGSWHFFPAIINSQIHNNIDLVEGTQGYAAWRKQPFPLKFKIIFFEVSNPTEVQNGGKAMVKEVGPYVFDEYQERMDVSVDEERDVLKYNLRKTFYFNQTDSGCHHLDDDITIINAALVGTAMQVNTLLPSALPMVTEAVPFLYPGIKDIFLRVKVKDILFEGVRLYCQDPSVDMICGAMKTQMPKTMRVAENGKDFLFSMFGHLNGTDDGPWEMGRGLKNTTRGQIYNYKNQDVLDIWGDKYCNQINGSDSTVFEPITTPKRPPRLYSFAQDFCRSLYASYDKESEDFGIPTMHYISKVESLANSDENRCFCPTVVNEEGEEKIVCPPSGVTDITPCVKAPVLVSYPHFYLGDPKLLEYVSGLNPQKHLHENYAKLEPRTATPLAGRKRVQMNIELRQLDGFDWLDNVTQGIFPILWLEEGVDLPEDFKNMLVSNQSKIGYLDILKWILISTGALLVTTGFLLLLKQENMMCFAKNEVVNITIPRRVATLGEVNMGYEMNPNLYPQIEHKNTNEHVVQRRTNQPWESNKFNN